MDFRKLARASASINGTEHLNLAELPPNILESLIPGYGLISRYIATVFGIDISIFVSIGIILIAITKAGSYIYERITSTFRQLFISTVIIDDDDLFDMVMAWLAENQGARSQRSVRAKTQRGSRVDNNVNEQGALDENGIFDYNKWSARTPPRYEPHYGRQMLWQNGRIFFFKRAHREATGRLQIHYGGGPEDDVLYLDCFGNSTEPIRALLVDIKVWTLNQKKNTTTIRHPTPKDRARYSGSWSKSHVRDSRPMDTVILDNDQKMAIIKDMNEFLHPASPRWYASRGIPYRRGYLFTGEPGTGKTSFSFALAGIFGLEIYVISLQEPTLSEGDLMQLFNSLPRRCIVLLEDVDAAGLIRDGQSDKNVAKKPKTGKKIKGGKGDGKNESVKDGEKTDDKKSTKESEKTDDKKSKKDEDFTLKDLARELKALNSSSNTGRRSNDTNNNNNNNSNDRSNRAPGTGISLSGLLNAIDGVASHEGRCLILTTNHVHKLDAALLRPGRVDRKVEFRLALKEQIRELFVRMYAASDQIPDLKPNVSKVLTSGHHKKGQPNGTIVSDKTQLAGLTAEDIEGLAAEFAEYIPDDTFTPAEIQNHLMLHKTEPRKAVDEAGRWVQKTLEDKEKLRLAKEQADNDDDDDDNDDNDGDDDDKEDT